MFEFFVKLNLWIENYDLSNNAGYEESNTNCSIAMRVFLFAMLL